MRGKLSQNVGWTFSAYRAQNYNDIQFISSTTTGAGFFDNVGKTRRQGIDAALNGSIDRFSWNLGYSFVKATYQSEFEIVSEINETIAGSGVQQVGKGDRIPGIPQHQLKLRAAFDITPSWNIGTNIFAFSDQYSRGNENNDYDGKGAKVAGYTVMNLDTRYNFSNGWQLFAKLNNVFDKEYNNGGLLGHHRFDSATGQFTGNEVLTPFFAPGAPRAGWFGVRYEFGGAKKSAVAVDND